MQKVRKYSIETDETIFLQFKDGSDIRVPVGDLALYVGSADLNRIERAIQVRKLFFQRHLPKLGLALAAGTLLSFAGLNSNQELHTLLQPQSLPTESLQSDRLNSLPAPKPLHLIKPSPDPHRSDIVTASPLPSSRHHNEDNKLNLRLDLNKPLPEETLRVLH